MAEELDPRLLRAFAARAAPPRDARFTAAVAARVAHARRRQRAGGLLLWAFALAALALATPTIVEMSRDIALGTVHALRAAGEFIASPPGLGAAGLIGTLAWLGALRALRRLR